MTSKTNLKLASFDSGDVRGLSQLEIMGNIMHRLNWDRRSNGTEPLPCEHFDLMGGSGTGGLIAIMLARLRMTIEEASEEFCTIIEEVYNRFDITPNERTQSLKQCIEAIMTKKQLSVDMRLLDEPQTENCACFVVASPRINMGTKICLRSYPVKSHQKSAITIVEAILATCTTQPAFQPVTVGQKHKRKEYIGAGLGASNPINEVIAEAHSLFGGDSTVASLLSVGSGHPGIITLPSNSDEVELHRTMRDIMDDCMERAREVKQRIGRAGIYYRFSVEQGMQNDQALQAMNPEWIVTQTESYLENQVDELEAFVQNNSSLINVTCLDNLKTGNVEAMLPANLDMMKMSDAGPNNEVVILAKLKPLNLECGPAVGECMAGTRLDIITSILDWTLDFNAPNIFWVKGHPGVGKSAIAVSVTENLRRSKRLASSFFFQRQRANALTPNTLWRVAAYDLARKYPTIRKRLIVALTANEALITTLNTETLFRELIHDPLTTCYEMPIDDLPIIVIDALDECGGLDGQRSEHRTNLRRTLKDWSHLPRTFKLIVTSREETDFEQVFSTTDHVPLEMHAGEEAQLQSFADIEKFLEDQFQEILNRYQSGLAADWPGSLIIRELALKSGGLFIWAKTIIEFLNRGEPQEQLSQILAGAGEGGMATLYSWILKTAFPYPSGKVINAFHSLAGTIIIAKDPLPASSIMELCSIDEPMMKYIRNGLQSVMTSGDVPRFKHQSIVDFLVDPTRCPPAFLIDQNHQNRKLTLECLLVMKRELKFNICDIESSFYRNSDIPGLASKVKKRILPHTTYSCCFWTEHLTESRFDPEIYGAVCDFMHNRFLFWIEVLSLTKRVGLASSVMEPLIYWLQAAGLDDRIASDMKKFISMFGSVISRSVPHIYLSALPFSPDGSLVLKEYGRRYPQTIRIRSGGQNNWPALQKVLIGHTSYVNSVAFSPDGKRIVSGSFDGTIRVWDAETGEGALGPFKGHTLSVESVAFSPDGKHIVSGSWDETVRVWDAETGEVVAGPFKGHTSYITSVAFSPNGRYIVSGSWDNTIRVWNAETGKVVSGPLKGHTDFVTSVAFSPDGRYVVSGSWDDTIRVWDAGTGEIVAGPFKSHTNTVTSVSFSPDGKFFVSGSDDKTIRVWDMKNGEVFVGPFEGHTDAVTSIAFSPDGKRVVSGSDDRTIRVWDMESGELDSGPFEGHTREVISVSFSPDGRRIVSGSLDQTIRIWDTETGEVTEGSFEDHIQAVTSVAFSPDGKRIVSGSRDKTIRVWDTKTGEIVLGSFEGHTRSIDPIAFSPDGRRVVSGSWDNKIRVWDTETGEVVSGPFEGHTSYATSIAFSPDGKRVVSGSSDNTVRVWDTEAGGIALGPFEGHTRSVDSVAFSPNGRRVVSGSRDRQVRVWDTETSKFVAGPFRGHIDTVTSVSFSPDGKYIVSGSRDRTIRIWGTETGETNIWQFIGHTESVKSIKFSPDGKCVLSGSEDKTIRVWDVETGEVVAGPFEGHTDCINCVAFSPDGNSIVSSSDDSTIRVWDLTNYASELPLFTERSKLVDGWVLGPNSELLFWIPPELWTGLWRPGNTLVLGGCIKTQLDFKWFAHGQSWSRCKDLLPEEPV